MGWVWRDDDAEQDYDQPNINPSSSPNGGDGCSTRKVARSQCHTEEVEPGKFVRKCEKTEEILKNCVGRPVEVVQSNKEYTEEDVTEQVLKGSFSLGSSEQVPFDFPGLRSDIEEIERSLFGGLGRFFDAAEEMKNGFFDIFGSPHFSGRDSSSSAASTRKGIPIESRHQEPSPKHSDTGFGHVDLSGLARDV